MLKGPLHYPLFPLFLALLVWHLAARPAFGQSTAFTYQGRLTDAGGPANGQYDFQFKLFDTQGVSTGTQQGSTVAVSNVTVTAGVFNAQLDFGSAVFPGAPRFLEIAVKKTSDPTFTTLTPRQPVAANPYSIHTLKADGLSLACVNCITSSQIQNIQGSQVSGAIAGSQISGAIPVASIPAGSTNYVQNSTSPQAATSFNISGNGTAGGTLSGNVVNAGTQFNIGGIRILGNTGASNLFAGESAGIANTTGFQNAFVGTESGANNTTGRDNAFFGQRSGSANATGGFNSFFGSSAGTSNTAGTNNSFFGFGAGTFNTMGNDNSFVGWLAGFSNTTAVSNSFFGSSAGFNNTTGSSNSFFGKDAGNSNTIQHDNTFIGSAAGKNNGTNDTSGIANFNTFVGGSAGLNNRTGDRNSFFGEFTGSRNTTGNLNSFFGQNAGNSNTTGYSNSFFGHGAGIGNTTSYGNTFIGEDADFFGILFGTEFDNTLLGVSTEIWPGVSNSTAIGAFAIAFDSNTIQLGTTADTVSIFGSLDVTGSKNFKIDHPLDPENKYLYHAAIESSEVLNIYSGNVTTNENGEATVTLAEWFEAINRDFRYQLTVIGTFAQAIVASEISNHRFSIKTNAPMVRVSWQVTGIRSDAGLLRHPFKVEEDKPESERGRYLNPEGFGQPEERGIEWVGSPERIQRLKQRQSKP